MTKIWPNVVQQLFRIRDDDGSETGATWLEDLNDDHTLSADNAFRIRFEIEETAGASEGAFYHEVYYSRNSGAWTLVEASDTYIRPELSSEFADGDDCTQQLGSGTFFTNNNSMVEDGQTENLGLAASTHTEQEYCMKFQWSAVSDEDTFDFRVERYNGDTHGLDLDGYTNTPRITIDKGGVAEVFGSATISPSATISNIPSKNTALASASLSATGDMDDVAATVSTTGAATLSATATIENIPAFREKFGSATLSASATIENIPSLNTCIGTAALSASATIENIPSFNTAIGLATLSATGTIVDIPSISTIFAAATLSAEGLVEATGDVEAENEVFGSATISASGTISNIPSLITQLASATLSVTGAITNTPTLVTQFASATLSAAATIEDIPSFRTKFGSVTVIAIGTVEGDGYNTSVAAASISVAGTVITTDTFNTALASATLLGIGVVEADGFIEGEEEAEKKRLPRFLKRGIRKTQPSRVTTGQRETIK